MIWVEPLMGRVAKASKMSYMLIGEVACKRKDSIVLYTVEYPLRGSLYTDYDNKGKGKKFS